MYVHLYLYCALFHFSFPFVNLHHSIILNLELHLEDVQVRIEGFHMTPYCCPKTMKWQQCWCSKPILFLMSKISFVPINLHNFSPHVKRLCCINNLFLKFQVSGVTINNIESLINHHYDLSVRFTILCLHISILVQFLHTFSRVPLVSYYIVKSESRSL